MYELAKRTTEFLGDLAPEAIVGALLLALVIAMTTAGTFRWLARRKPNASTLLVCLVLLANLACILATLGYVQSTVPTVRLIERRGRPPRDRIINLYDHAAQPDSRIE
jgi:predicted PurR-regulated permease PerM